jgi:5-methylcytosine-specific restriction endonuclease McrA
MWEGTSESYALKHKISKKTAKRFQCTAEHLLARCDGGKDSTDNIVAACVFCNKKRHARKKQLAPCTYKKLIEKRLERGKWHPRKLHVLRTV